MALCTISLADPAPNPATRRRSLGEESSSYRPPDLNDGFKILLNKGIELRRRLPNSRDILMTKDYDLDSDICVVRDDDAIHLLELSAEPEITLHHLGSRALAQLRAKMISSRKETRSSVFCIHICKFGTGGDEG